jgi:glycosyltransferase involved in cell wall biosynthesis
VRPEFGDVTFVLAGDDQGRSAYRNELYEHIAALGLNGQILLPGHCSDMPAALLAASLTIVPSIEPEAFGRIAIEAQAMGCPVIVSELGALPETIVSERNAHGGTPATGWVFAAGDEEALAARIAAALSLPGEEAAAMATAARRHVVSNFSKTVLQRNTLQVYDRLLDTALSRAFERSSSEHEDSMPSPTRIRLYFICTTFLFS